MKKSLFIISLFSIVFFSCSENSDSDSPVRFSEGGEVPLGQGGSLARFGIMGDHLYAVNWNTLNTFDISDAANPVYQKNTQVGTEIETIFIRQTDNIVFLGSQRGMYIYDAADPLNLQFKSVYQHVFACDPVVANDKYAFVTLNSDVNLGCFRGVDQLEIINIENLNSPFSEEIYPMNGPKGLGLDDSLLFVCDQGLRVFNFQGPKNLTQIDFHDISAFDVIPNVGNFEILFVIGEEGLYQYQYRDAQLELLSIISLGS